MRLAMVIVIYFTSSANFEFSHWYTSGILLLVKDASNDDDNSGKYGIPTRVAGLRV